MLSFSAPQAGHLLLSVFLQRLRYLFSGVCVILNCEIVLAALRDERAHIQPRLRYGRFHCGEEGRH